MGVTSYFAAIGVILSNFHISGIQYDANVFLPYTINVLVFNIFQEIII